MTVGVVIFLSCRRIFFTYFCQGRVKRGDNPSPPDFSEYVPAKKNMKEEVQRGQKNHKRRGPKTKVTINGLKITQVLSTSFLIRTLYVHFLCNCLLVVFYNILRSGLELLRSMFLFLQPKEKNNRIDILLFQRGIRKSAQIELHNPNFQLFSKAR